MRRRFFTTATRRGSSSGQANEVLNLMPMPENVFIILLMCSKCQLGFVKPMITLRVIIIFQYYHY